MISEDELASLFLLNNRNADELVVDTKTGLPHKAIYKRNFNGDMKKEFVEIYFRNYIYSYFSDGED